MDWNRTVFSSDVFQYYLYILILGSEAGHSIGHDSPSPAILSVAFDLRLRSISNDIRR